MCMPTRLFCLSCLILLAILPATVLAQSASRYENPSLGIAFDLPAGWEVAVDENRMVAAATNDLSTVQQGGVPDGLVIRIVIGSFSELGITDAAELPTLLARLEP